MDLKIAGLCIILVVISENVEARHLTGGRPPSIFGYQDFRFPRTFGLRGGIPNIRQRLARHEIGRLGGTSNPRRISPFGSRLGSSRFPSLSALGTNPLSFPRRQIGGIGRFPTRRPFRLNPTLSSARRRFRPQSAGRRSRLPFLYYGQRRINPIGGPRSRAIPNDAIRQLRQRFRTTGTGTRNDPIRIISPLSPTSGALPRSSRPQRRPVQLSRARQQLLPRQQEEVIALFGFDQPGAGSIGTPILSETIDKQTKIKRTPIKKSPLTDSKIIKATGSVKRKEKLRSVNISKPITDEFLQKLSVHQLERLATGVAEATKTSQVQHEVKRVAKVTEKQLVKSELIKTSPSTDTGSLTSSPKIDSAINTVISDADSVNININGTSDALISNTNTGNENNNNANDKNIATTEQSVKAGLAVDTIGVPVSATLGEHIAETFTTEAKTAIFNPEPVFMQTNVGHSLHQAETFSIDPAGISVIPDTAAREIHSIDNTENIGSVSSASIITSERAIPVEHVHVSDVVVPAEAAVIPVGSVSVPDAVVPIETISTAEVHVAVEGASLTDAVVPIEATVTAEIQAALEGASVTDAVFPIEPTATAEIQAAEGVQVTDIAVPVEATATSEVYATVEGLPVTDVVVPVDEIATAEVQANVEGVQVTNIVVPVEAAATAEVHATVEGVHPVDAIATAVVQATIEGVPVTDVIIPVEATSTAKVEGVLVTDIVVPVEATGTAEVKATIEEVPGTDVIIPVEATATTKVLATVEGVQVNNVVIPVEAAATAEVHATVESVLPVDAIATAEVQATIEGVPVTDVIIPVETTGTAEVKATIDEVPVTDVIIPVETTADSKVVATVQEVPVVVSIDTPAENVILSDKIIPVKLSTASDSVIAGETYVSKEIPVPHVSETKKLVESAALKKVSSSVVETASAITDASSVGKVSAESIMQVDYPIAETVTNLPIKHDPIVGHDIHSSIIPEQHVSVGKSVHHLELSPITTKGKLFR